MYQNLAKSNDYYGLMAKDKIGQRFDASRLGGSNLPNVSTADRARVMQDANFARAFALYNSEASRVYANREWNWAVKQARDNRDDNLIIAAARQAYDMGWLDRAIYAVDNTDRVDSLALSHPMPHQSAVVRYSESAGIDPAWAYGIMRQESRFVSSARSNVGASGLMQVMPDTAKYIARNLGETYSASRANSGDTNIRYGTWYMGDILGKLNYQPVLATAGYNAGPNNAKRWQPVYGSLAADQYVESIAFPETRNYVKHVMENATIYSSLLGRGQPISQRMGTVPAGF
jgi:soluble lytic murein transglycosylase